MRWAKELGNSITSFRRSFPEETSPRLKAFFSRYHQRMGWTSPEAREIFQWFVKQEAERRRVIERRSLRSCSLCPSHRKRSTS